MAFTEIQGQGEVTISLGGTNKKTNKANPTSIEGYYLGSRVIDQNGTESLIHQFQTDKGSVDVWGKTDLNKKLASIDNGVMTRVTYTGTRPIPGKNPMYTFKVEADDSNTLDLSDVNSSTAGLDEEETDVDNARLPDEVTTIRAAVPRLPAQSPSTTRTKELLAKRG